MKQLAIKEQLRTRGYVEPFGDSRNGPPGMDTKPRSEQAKSKGTAGRFQVLNQFVDESARLVSSTAQATWYTLYRETKPNGLAIVSHAQIGEMIGLSRRVVMRAVKELVEAGLVTVTERGIAAGHKPSTYRIHSTPKRRNN